MWNLLRDALATASLKIRYQRLIHEQLMQLTEANAPPRPLRESTDSDSEPGRWMPVSGLDKSLGDDERTDARTRARELARTNPHARNLLRLLEVYVAGPGLTLSHQPASAGDQSVTPILQTADRLWSRFLEMNLRHYSYREHCRRTWRDGEAFVRKFPSAVWPPSVRFIDPEQIGDVAGQPALQGIETDPDDVEVPIAYQRLSADGRQLAERIDASEVMHTRVGVDTNQKRGVTIFSSVLDTLTCFNKWVETELTARKLQSSIVLWRKVQGSPQQSGQMTDQATGGSRREPIRPGTILTTNQATEIQFLQPNTNFGDAVPLGRMLLLNIAAGAGLPEFMLTSDASNANYSSTMVAEGPAVKLFQSEQQFFAAEFQQLWRWIMSEAVDLGLLPVGFIEMVTPRWTFPQLVTRDRPRERLADVRLVESGVLSRAEVARRDGADPTTMQVELSQETNSAAEKTEPPLDQSRNQS